MPILSQVFLTSVLHFYSKTPLHLLWIRYEGPFKVVVFFLKLNQFNSPLRNVFLLRKKKDFHPNSNRSQRPTFIYLCRIKIYETLKFRLNISCLEMKEDNISKTGVSLEGQFSLTSTENLRNPVSC